MFVQPHEKKVTLGTASQREKSYAVETAKKINKALKGWGNFNAATKDEIKNDLHESGVPLVDWGYGFPDNPVDVNKVSEDDEKNLIKLLGKIYEYEDANKDLSKKLTDDFKDVVKEIDGIDIDEASADMLRVLVLSEYTRIWDTRVYDSDYDRIISTVTYDILNKSTDVDIIQDLVKIFRNNSLTLEGIKNELQQMTGRV